MAKAYGYDKADNWQSPVIHVVNKTDLGRKAINEERLSSTFDNIHDFVKISCKTLKNFDSLEESIRTILPKVSKDIFNNLFSKKWFKVKEILEERRPENHITFTEYQEICTEKGLNESEGNLWLDYLDRIGSLIYFGNDGSLKNFIVLNPLWVKDSMYKVLDSPFTQKGILEEHFLPFIWTAYSEEEHKNLLSIMLAYKFCYPAIDNQGHRFYIIPALLPSNKPVVPHYLGNFNFELRFDYFPFIPAGTVNKLMVELNEHIFLDLKWKNGCILHLIEGNKMSFAEVVEDWENKAVYVRIGGYNLSAIYTLIRKTLSQLLQDLKKIKYLDALDMEVKVKFNDSFESPKTIISFGKEKDFGFLFGKEHTETEKMPNNSMTIKIFLASSGELKEDRDELRLFIAAENDLLNARGIYLKLVQWEFFLDAISETGLQKKYNHAINECDIMLSLFFTKAGKYTQEEFDTAYQCFLQSGKPAIYTYFKNAPVNMNSIDEEIINLLDFKKRLKDMGHYPTSYTNIDDLKVQFKRQLEILLSQP